MYANSIVSRVARWSARHRRIAILGWMVAVVVWAQPVRTPPRRTVSQLGSCVQGRPAIVAVTDGLSTSDCSVGGALVPFEPAPL